MKTLNLCLLIVTTIFIFSCKKDKVAVCRISQVIFDNNAAKTATFSYDENGRPTDIIAKDQSTRYIFTYSGLTGKVEFRDVTTNALYGSVNLTFDGNGRLKSYEEFYVPASDTLRYFYQFEYNAEGYLFRNIQTLTGGVYNTYYCDSLIYSNGNVVKMYTKLKNGTNYVVTDYEYSSELNTEWNYFFSLYSAGEPFSILSGYYNLEPLLGKPTKNLPSKITTSGSYSEVHDFTYIFDASKKVTEYTQVRNYNSSVSTYNFKLSYACN
ncbi:MAG TPA: DUF4595 domain-containing protein [Chitinophagales bacterium]|nr:DUF4595 domain-containing protein [Chitinophagales bacterium]